MSSELLLDYRHPAQQTQPPARRTSGSGLHLTDTGRGSSSPCRTASCATPRQHHPQCHPAPRAPHARSPRPRRHDARAAERNGAARWTGAGTTSDGCSRCSTRSPGRSAISRRTTARGGWPRPA
ncbi:hypothetical protein HBB16_21475 [Pseudonocardia sp. MCCB 268]|nr:hypothetical protein [Pseudonocardia cytotoxica]